MEILTNSMMPRCQLYSRLSEASGVGVGGYLTVTAVFTTFYLRSQKGKKQRTTFYKIPNVIFYWSVISVEFSRAFWIKQ
jgi:hypothetical protein